MESVAADIRHGFRVLQGNPGVTAIAVVALALGIGANTAIFSVINTVLLRPLPYPGADRLVEVGRKYPDGFGPSASIPKFMTWKRNSAFSAVSAYDFGGPGLNLSQGDHPEQIKGIHVSADFFKVFGIAPAQGRTFSAEEDSPGGPRVVLISEALWRNRLGGDPAIIGRAVPLNGDPYTVIGIIPKSYRADPEADVWLPLQPDPNTTNQGHYLLVTARLKPGVTVERAEAEAKVLGEQFRRANPKWMDKNESVGVTPLQRFKTGDVRPVLLVLMGAVAFVLLIACANVANLLLARAAARQKEIAIRSAIGASRWRVMRQLLTESIMLAGFGGVLGLGLGIWSVRALLALAPGNIPRVEDLTKASLLSVLDWRIAAFTVAVCVLTGILFGVFPALHVARTNVAATLKENSGRGATGTHHNRTRVVLMVTELALALVLLTGAALFIRTFVGLRHVDPGFDPHNILTMETSLIGAKYNTTAAVDRLTRQAVERIESLPGVQAAATSILKPVTNDIDLPFTIEGKPPAKGNLYNGDEQWRSVSAHYFNTFRIPLLRGRGFNDHETASSTHVVVINSAMAKKYWPNQDPIGQRITIGKGLGPEFEEGPREIIGIAGNVRENGLNDEHLPGVMYVPANQLTDGFTQFANRVIPIVWAVRAGRDPRDLRAAIQREFLAIDPQLGPTNVLTMEQVIADSIARQSFNMLLLTIFASIALLLAAVGIYGLMSYSVAQRTHELGIRMALGANRGDTLRLVVFQGARLAVAGVVIGILLAYGLSRLVAAFLFGVRATDPVTFLGVAALLTLVVLAASYVPARRATRVDPVIALRYE